MKRLHVHVSVKDLNESIGFYSAMFATRPSVTKPDYAKWMLDDPRMNFAISQRNPVAGVNHLGIQVESAAELQEMHERLDDLSPDMTTQTDKACCYARSDKYWINDPQGLAWETFHTLDDIPVFGDSSRASTESDDSDAGDCCIPLAQQGQQDAPCCVPKHDAGAPSDQTSGKSCC